MPRGGARLGAGRKKKDSHTRWLDGGADRRGSVPCQAPETAPIGDVEIPVDLTPSELAIWLVNAPHARDAGTLTPATAEDFVALCRLEVEMAGVLEERRLEGWTSRGLQLAKEYRGLVARVEGKRRAFRLAPMGKEMTLPAAPKDEFGEFDQGLKVLPGGKP